MQTKTETRKKPYRVAVIGAGFSGLGVAEALKRSGIDYDQYERHSDIGGLWHKGVYKGAHLITPKKSTGYLKFPMPVEYPDYPSREQVKKYLQKFCAFHGLQQHLTFNTVISNIEPIDQGERWNLVFENGEQRQYDSVVVATGHHWIPYWPEITGTFDGEQIHSGNYETDAVFHNRRVLVVGGGNSAADIVVAASKQGVQADISMRQGHWFLPKILFGRPIGEILKPWFPNWLIRLFLAIAVGDYRHYGLAKPNHGLFEEDHTINDSLLNGLRHGKINAFPGIRRLDGNIVEFVDGRRQQYDVICWATGYHVKLPCVDESIISVNDNIPDLVAGMYAPYHKNLYVFGVGHLIKPIPRYGVGPMISAGADLLALSMLAQQRLEKPIVRWVSMIVGKPKRFSVGPTYALKMTQLLVWILGMFLRKRKQKESSQENTEIVSHD